jgi:hypothetical protein
MGYGRKNPATIKIDNPNVAELESQLAQNTTHVKDTVGVDIEQYPRLDSETDDSGRLKRAIDNELIIRLKSNTTYTISSDLIFDRLDVTLMGGENTVIQNIGTGHGIQVTKRVRIEKITVNGSSNSKSGIFIESGCTLNEVKSYYNGRYGVEFSNTKHVVSVYMDRITAAYNKLGGVYCNSTGISQKNLITMNRFYVVKNGTDADNLVSDGTPASGHGFYINGGLSISISDSVTEYNTGAGLYLDNGTGYTLKGLSVSGMYYEQNKYASLLINYTNGNWENINITGSSYTTPYAYPSNSIIPTKGHVAVLDRLPVKEDIIIDGKNILSNEKADVAFSRVSLKPNEIFDNTTLFPYSTSGRVRNDLPECEGFNCLVINKALGGFQESGFNNYLRINPYLDYIVEIEYKLFLDGVGNGAMYLQRRTKTGPITNGVGGNDFSIVPTASATFIKKQYIYKASEMGKDTRALSLLLTINNGMTDNSCFIVKSLAVYPVHTKVIKSGTTAERPSRLLGAEYFDTTLNKPIWGGNSSWVDANGTTV